MRLTVSASTLPELFAKAATALLAPIIDPAEIGSALQEKLVIEAEDFSSLLEAWLTALLELLRDQNILPKTIAVEGLDTTAGQPYALRAKITGELRDPHRHAFRCTPQTLRVGETTLEAAEGGWCAQIDLQIG